MPHTTEARHRKMLDEVLKAREGKHTTQPGTLSPSLSHSYSRPDSTAITGRNITDTSQWSSMAQKEQEHSSVGSKIPVAGTLSMVLAFSIGGLFLLGALFH